LGDRPKLVDNIKVVVKEITYKKADGIYLVHERE
jgi:hypothetical protein